MSRARRYNPDLGEPPEKPPPSGSAAEDAENLREFVKEADSDASHPRPQPSGSRSPVVSVPVCGVTLTSDKNISIQDVAEVSYVAVEPLQGPGSLHLYMRGAMHVY